MATAALISPSGPYHPHHAHAHAHSHSHSSPYSTGYGHTHTPTTSIPGMISPVDTRRTSDDSESSHRQSLPSISEVISGAKPSAYPPQAASSIAPSQAQSLPSPFGSATSRSFTDAGSEKNPSPRTLHPTSGYPRPDALPAFSDPSRPALSSRPAPPPLNTFPGQHPSPSSVKLEHFDADQRHAEASQLSAGYQHSHGQPSSAGLYQSGRLPPGQLPLSGYPVSPRNNGPTLPSPFDSQRTPVYGDDGDYNRGNEYKNTVDRAFETFGFGATLHAVRFGFLVNLYV